MFHLPIEGVVSTATIEAVHARFTVDESFSNGSFSVFDCRLPKDPESWISDILAHFHFLYLSP
jgi:hypothetical protein